MSYIGNASKTIIQQQKKKSGLQDLKPIPIPMDMNIRLTTAQSPSTTTKIVQMYDVSYHKAIGSFIYTALGTCPDIAFTIQTILHFLMRPRPMHWEAIKRIFQNLKDTMELWLLYGMSKMDLTG